MITRASKSDVYGRRQYGRNIEDLREFVRSGWDVAEVQLDGRSVASVYSNLWTAIRHHPEFAGVHPTRKGGRLFLVMEK